MNMIQRPRRLRISSGMRDLVRETELSPRDFVYPIFVVPGEHIKEEIPSMPGCYHYSVDQVAALAREIAALGIPAVEVFGLPEYKDEIGSSAWDMTSPGELHDHYVDNDATLPHLVKTAISQARAGADIVAPSDMMDGRVAAIRAGLDAEGFVNTSIMSYAVKYASGYYGPFRDAVDSTPSFGDRRQYQMDSANAREALKEAALDVQEGADIIMVKPALVYLDIVRQVYEATDRPIAVYNVSGEYAMVKAAAANEWIDEQRIVLETLTSMKRAGAKIIITYHAMDAAAWLTA